MADSTLQQPGKSMSVLDQFLMKHEVAVVTGAGVGAPSDGAGAAAGFSEVSSGAASVSCSSDPSGR